MSELGIGISAIIFKSGSGFAREGMKSSFGCVIFSYPHPPTTEDKCCGWLPRPIYRPKDGAVLQFIEQEDGVINVMDSSDEPVGDIIKQNGVYRVSLLFSYSSSKGLMEIANKLAELSKKDE